MLLSQLLGLLSSQENSAANVARHLRQRSTACAFSALLLALLLAAAPLCSVQETQRQYLSGTGNDDMAEWKFTVTGGRRAGEEATIPVPSQWELQGFGTY